MARNFFPIFHLEKTSLGRVVELVAQMTWETRTVMFPDARCSGFRRRWGIVVLFQGRE